MKKNAFTLIEVMVVMAIISILAGMLMPVAWRFWESEEIATTRQRMKDLKIAMIGDRNLVQNGVRTHYGFVGDFGTLPFSNISSCAFNYLYSNTNMALPRFNPDNWSGSYLPSSSDLNNYAADAWGKPIQCANKKFQDGRFVEVTLTSVAPSGEVLEEVISINDVIPTKQVTGNVYPPAFHSISSGASLKIKFSPGKPGSFLDMSTCKQLNGVSNYEAELPYEIPIGKVNVELRVTNNTNAKNCSTPTAVNKFNYFVHDNQTVIKMPDLNIP